MSIYIIRYKGYRDDSPYFSTSEQFKAGLCEVNWLDPSDKGTPKEQEKVLRLLWNFSVEQEKKEEELYGGGNYDE